MAKGLDFFSKLQQVLQYTLAAHSEKSFVPAFLKVSIDHDTYLITLSVEKKMLERSLKKVFNHYTVLDGCSHCLFVVASGSPLLREVFLRGTPVFPSPQKPTFPNSNLTRNQVKEEPLFGCATSI